MMSSRIDEFELVVDCVAHETSEVLVLELMRPDGGALPCWTPGAHVDLILPSGKVRQYSLCGDVACTARYRIAVRREKTGRGGSEEIHATTRSGTSIRLRGPRNHFQLVDAQRYLFLAGGIGITPILPMIRHVERTGRSWRLVYGGRTREAMGFVDEIAKRNGGTITLLPEDECGLPNIDELLSGLGPDVAIYGCGPAGMLKALKSAAVQHGCIQALHIESFSPGEADAKAAGENEEKPFEVELRQSGVVLQVPADRSLGDVLQDADIPVPFSCQEGYCGSCETRVLEGVPDHRDSLLTDEEKASGNVMMVCCGRSHTPRLVLDL